MASNMKLLVFGDQSENVIPALRQLTSVTDNPLLVSFFENAYTTLRDEVAQHPLVACEIPGFASLSELVRRYSDSGAKSPAIESALTYTYQIACFLRVYGDGSEPYPNAEDTRLIGLCSGLLAATTISCSHTYLRLVNLSTEVLRTAFRVGAQVGQVRDELEQQSLKNAGWSAIYPGMSDEAASDALVEFHTLNGTPPTDRAYISATSSNAVTISGLPRVLDQLASSETFSKFKPVRISIYGPYHAPHLYSDSTFSEITETIAGYDDSHQKPRIPIISGDNHEVISTFRELMESAIRSILIDPLNLDKIRDKCVADLRKMTCDQRAVIPVGRNNTANSFVTALRRESGLDFVLDDRFSVLPTSDNTPHTGRLSHSNIAIVGMSGRFPEAANPSEFWDLLLQGLDVHKEIPSDRFDAQAHYDPNGKRKNTSHTPFGCFMKDPGLFDARFFNMSPREATQTDPMHRLALMTAYEALEMSGYVPNRTPSTMLDRIGTFYGQTSDDWREIQNGQDIQTYFIPGGVRAFAPGRINYHFKFSGPSFSVDTACSSSLAAINIACNSLWQGDCDTAVAGGLNVLTNSDIFSGLSRGQFLSKTGNCQTYDDNADGYCRGDGVGTVILKRLEDAEADKDPILAVIRGTGTNHSAEAVSITHPHAGAQEYLFKKTLSEAGVDPHDISYVEMHGTGTQAGDSIEMKSVLGAFAPETPKRRHDQPLHLGSVKANVGHGEAASGITALVKILLMLDNNMIPPHCGIKTKMNHTFPDLGARNVHIALDGPSPWNRPEGGKRSFFLNNFSAAGGNTSLLLEDGPARCNEVIEDTRSTAVVALSGKTKATLKANIENMVRYLDDNPSTDLPSLSYTTTARRNHYADRVIVSGSNVQTIQKELEKLLTAEISPAPSKAPRVAFAFTGQGSHYSAMGKEFFNTTPQFASNLQRFDRLARQQGFPSFLPLIDGSAKIEELSPVVVQVGAVCIQMALTRLWASWGIKPAVVVGHSLGEYAALHAAGVLSTSDTIFLTGIRATLLETKCSANTHAMLAVSAGIAEIGNAIDGNTFEVACINGPKATVLSGKAEDIDLLAEDLAHRSMKCTKLPVPFAFHSSQVEPVLEEFQKASKGVTFNTPTVPIISPLMSSVVTDNQTFDAEYLSRHCRETVNFLGGIRAAEESSIVTNDTIFIEVGAHPVCSGMVKSILGSKVSTVPSLRRGEDAWKIVSGSLSTLYSAGVDINWNSYHQDFSQAHQCLRLPTYGWNNQNYWIDYSNNWNLTKGENAVVPDATNEPNEGIPTKSVQRIVEAKFDDHNGTMTTESDISHPDFEETIKGHIVNGAALCSSAVYADMALTVADHIHRKLEPTDENFAMDCSHMVVDKPLIAKDDNKPQLLRTSCTADLSQQTCHITFYSVNSDGKKTIEHAKCTVKYDDSAKWSSQWDRQTYLLQPQVDRLFEGAQSGDLSKLQRNMAYKLFSVLVDYQDVYKGMSEVILDSPKREGTARVELRAGKTDDFYIPPYHIDSLCHLAGFIMNANDEVDSTKTVYVNHGWKSLRFTEKPSADQTYRSYVRMQSTGGKDFAGDVYIFNEEGKNIGQICGLEFQFMPKQLLDRALPPAGGAKASVSAPAKKTAPKAEKTPAVSESKPKVSQATPTPSVANRALEIMAEEIGVPTSDLTDESELEALGVDSLLSLTITGKFREDLDIEVPSTLFSDDCHTVKEVKKYFNQHEPAAVADTPSSSTQASGTTTPDDASSMTSLSNEDDDDSVPKKGGEDVALIKKVLSQETGVPVSEITASTNMADSGIDSLMSLQILGSLREDHGVDLPSSFFADNETFGDIEKALGPTPKPSQLEKASTEEVVADIAAKEMVDDTLKKPSEISRSNLGTKPPAATSILLQGSSKTAEKTLFLFPDGSGSSTSYASIPPIGKDTALVGLNCPYMKDPTSYTCGIDGVVSLYLAEVQRRQPHGPYYLGGWSAGGVCAYEACLQLQAAGETVERLIFFDAPCPVALQPLPSRLHNFFNSIGLLGVGGTPPSWLLPHFEYSIKNLAAYHPGPMDPAKGVIPKTYSVMAQDGVCKNPDDRRPEPQPDDPPNMNWLLFNRTDFGPNGWEQLLGQDNITHLESVPDVNHFTMMREPGVKALGHHITEALK